MEFPEKCVRVLYDLSYETNDGRRIQILKDEEFVLLQTTTRDWWKVIRGGERRAFYAPAAYLHEIDRSAERKSPLIPENPVDESNEEFAIDINRLTNGANKRASIPGSNYREKLNAEFREKLREARTSGEFCGDPTSKRSVSSEFDNQRKPPWDSQRGALARLLHEKLNFSSSQKTKEPFAKLTQRHRARSLEFLSSNDESCGNASTGSGGKQRKVRLAKDSWDRRKSWAMSLEESDFGGEELVSLSTACGDRGKAYKVNLPSKAASNEHQQKYPSSEDTRNAPPPLPVKMRNAPVVKPKPMLPERAENTRLNHRAERPRVPSISQYEFGFDGKPVEMWNHDSWNDREKTSLGSFRSRNVQGAEHGRKSFECLNQPVPTGAIRDRWKVRSDSSISHSAAMAFVNPAYASNGWREDANVIKIEVGSPKSSGPAISPRSEVRTPMGASREQMGRQPSHTPPTPRESSVPVRIIGGDWAEYFDDESGRKFYFNSASKETTWKPPRKAYGAGKSNMSNSCGSLYTSSSIENLSGENLDEGDDLELDADDVFDHEDLVANWNPGTRDPVPPTPQKRTTHLRRQISSRTEPIYANHAALLEGSQELWEQSGTESTFCGNGDLECESVFQCSRGFFRFIQCYTRLRCGQGPH
ncbi:unnamed protein product [Notodromas monacha]|uniref:Uncharacterized protein n=1 Tax=Notodromas monacha TaxID=399045 RepID=A0A7R9BHS2_9CRUS|nr:unnamed protein product [Notodromas monacha]CAG0914957.1 unnamed protein product [Notodromas monacha]